MDTRDLDGALTVKEFCDRYSVGRSRLYEMMAAGEITARKCGTRTLIARREAERWFASLPAAWSAA